MFATLSYGEGQNGRLCRWWKKAFGERIVPQKIPVGRGECFFVAQVTPGARIRWEELFTCMGKLSREMVLPHGVLPPEGCGITPFVPQALEPRLVMNTAAELLMRDGGSRVPVTIFDPHGRLCSAVIPIVRACADVRIVTGNTAFYHRAGERIMEEYGASVQIRPLGEALLCGGVAVFPFGVNGISVPSNTIAVVPQGESSGENLLAVHGIRLGEEIRCLKPEGISDFLFAAALYEKCALRELGARTGEALIRSGQELSLPEAAVLLRGAGR